MNPPVIVPRAGDRDRVYREET